MQYMEQLVICTLVASSDTHFGQLKHPALNHAATFDQLVLPLLNVLALKRRTLWSPRQP